MAALRLLVTGSTGQVGGELVKTLAPLGEVLAPTRAQMDLANPISVRTFLRENRPQWIVNAAAYTAVDRAEGEPVTAHAINAESVGVIGQEAAAISATVLHYSTDYVFDGRGNIPYTETDTTGPLGVYGASKLAGERALAESGAIHAILRTSWVYGATGKNFLRTILKLAREKEQLRIVGDQYGAPTWSRDLARLAAHIIEHKLELPGIYHAAGAGETTWAGFAEEAIRQVEKREPGVKLARVVAIATSEYPTAATRPANSRLSGEKLARTFGWKMMDWQTSLAHVLAEMYPSTV